MKRSELKSMFGTEHPILGMIHLPPLPGSPNYCGDMTAVLDHALRDAETLAENGITSMIIENLGDYPYYPETTEPETVAYMTRVAMEIRKRYDMPLGINVLRNSWKSAMAVAAAADCQFIRLNVLTDGIVTDQGPITGKAYLLARYRKMLEAQHIKIFADIYTKHGAPMTPRDLDTVAKEMVSRGMADALIVDGAESAKPAPKEKILAVRAAVPDTPIFLGSGMTVDTTEYLNWADGCVFGFGTKPSGDMNDPVDGPTVKRFMEQVNQL